MQPTRYTAWRPSWRLHLAHVLLAAVLTLFSITNVLPQSTSMIPFDFLGGMALALCTRFPWPGAALGAAVTWSAVVVSDEQTIFLGLLPWLCAAILVARGFQRMLAYSLVVFTIVLMIADAQWGDVSLGWSEMLLWWGFVGGAALTMAELIRSPREQAERSLHTYRESMERQRLLVVTELHDTVVRDLTHAVMTAEQARLAHPEDTALAPELDAMTAAVRAAVEQMRHALRAMSDLRGGERLDIEATSAPRPLEEVLADAAAVLGQRGARLEVQGLELLGIPVIPPGVRLQLLRVLGELVTNMSKYTAPRGRARLVIESDGRSLEAMASNDVGAPGTVGAVGPAGEAWAGGGVPGVGMSGYGVFSSGLGLEGARRRVEALGGSLSVSRSEGRWATILSVPFQPSTSTAPPVRGHQQLTAR
ncbi:histidine kinase [Actinomyces sp. ZJ308]|uniref:sensor histidine kinase n=1 Tax=Actinomyces sp. ZJ308 TaxID=2708342 RepID=UPI001FB87C42|nr:histidine kinase [Actinomyces sp. ZJ308]